MRGEGRRAEERFVCERGEGRRVVCVMMAAFYLSCDDAVLNRACDAFADLDLITVVACAVEMTITVTYRLIHSLCGHSLRDLPQAQPDGRHSIERS